MFHCLALPEWNLRQWRAKSSNVVVEIFGFDQSISVTRRYESQSVLRIKLTRGWLADHQTTHWSSSGHTGNSSYQQLLEKTVTFPGAVCASGWSCGLTITQLCHSPQIYRAVRSLYLHGGYVFHFCQSVCLSVCRITHKWLNPFLETWWKIEVWGKKGPINFWSGFD